MKSLFRTVKPVLNSTVIVTWKQAFIINYYKLSSAYGPVAQTLISNTHLLRAYNI